MSMAAINNNLLALNTANNLTGHYKNLAISTERLSTGLRVNSAADDAAGLAIRELMRADIAALKQGMRNVNDAISMIQTFDGALSVIDEKLIRMKELAEQAATGTYDSTQRLMIDSEFQAMGSEINRIARATDFNGIKLIDGAFANEGIVGPDGKTYDKKLTGSFVDAWNSADATMIGGWDTSGIENPGALLGKTEIIITNDNIPMIGGNFLLVDAPGQTNNIPPGTTVNFQVNISDPTVAGGSVWLINGNPAIGTNNNTVMTTNIGGTNYNFSITDANGNMITLDKVPNGTTTSWTAKQAPAFTSNVGQITPTLNGNELTLSLNLGNNNVITQKWNLDNGESRAVSSVKMTLDITDTSKQPDDPDGGGIPKDIVRIHFGSGNDSAEDYYDVKKYDATLKGLGLEGIDIQTQEKAQQALVKIDDAIVAKDKIRADYGAMQNRFENTLSNITIQAENLQASESRISDTEIATEMMTFVKNQILTQSAVAMLAQANSMPQMVMRLIS